MNWREALMHLSGSREAHVLATLLDVRGSAPRNAGCKMIVSRNDTYDTIGGGQLEFEVISHSRQLLEGPVEAPLEGPSASSVSASAQPSNLPLIREFNLARDVAQCCGGTVRVLFECFAPRFSPLVLCGAGHVAQALISILRELPVSVTVLDSRQDWLERVPEHNLIKCARLDEPHRQIEQCCASSVFLVMTHSHDLDFELCEAILSRSDNPWCGLIASRSKAASFTARLSRKGFSAKELARLVTPVGLPDVAGKEPMAVAVSVAAQLLALPEFANRVGANDQTGGAKRLELPAH